MRIELSRDGGIGYFPGLRKPISVDVDALPAEDSARLKALIHTSGFHALLATVGAPGPGAADYEHCTVTIEDAGKRHSVRALVPVASAPLRDLIAAVETLGRRTGP